MWIKWQCSVNPIMLFCCIQIPNSGRSAKYLHEQRIHFRTKISVRHVGCWQLLLLVIAAPPVKNQNNQICEYCSSTIHPIRCEFSTYLKNDITIYISTKVHYISTTHACTYSFKVVCPWYSFHITIVCSTPLMARWCVSSSVKLSNITMWWWMVWICPSKVGKLNHHSKRLISTFFIMMIYHVWSISKYHLIILTDAFFRSSSFPQQAHES